MLHQLAFFHAEKQAFQQEELNTLGSTPLRELARFDHVCYHVGNHMTCIIAERANALAQSAFLIVTPTWFLPHLQLPPLQALVDLY